MDVALDAKQRFALGGAQLVAAVMRRVSAAVSSASKSGATGSSAPAVLRRLIRNAGSSDVRNAAEWQSLRMIARWC